MAGTVCDAKDDGQDGVCDAEDDGQDGVCDGQRMTAGTVCV